MHPLKACDIIMIVGWFVVGMIALFSTQINKWMFFCLLICYLCELGFKLIKNEYDDNDPDKPKMA